MNVPINQYITTDYKLFKSNRRELFIDIFLPLFDSKIKKDIILKIVENIHTAATIIDDMQDNEINRKNIPCYYIRHGYPTASFMALKLWNEAIIIINKYYNINDYLPFLEKLIHYQEADTGLNKRNLDFSPLVWYHLWVSKKIGEELNLLFTLCRNNNTKSCKTFEELLFKFGKLIQIVDDKQDVLDNKNYRENQLNNKYVLTYSLPVAMYLEYNRDDAFESQIGKMLNLSTFNFYYSKITTDFIRNKVKMEFIQVVKECKDLIEKLDYPYRLVGNKIFNQLQTVYWK